MFCYHQQHPCGLTAHQDPTNPFAFTPGQLDQLVEKRDVKLLSMLGGVEGVARGLHSHIIHGLSPEHEKYQLRPVSLYNVARMAINDDVRSQKSDQDNEDDIEDDIVGYSLSDASEQKHGPFFQRLAVYGSNVLPRVNHKSLLTLMWEAMHDKTLILLTISAAISLSVGIYEDLTSVEYDSSGNRIPAVKWVEGVSIIVAVLLVVLVGSINDYQKEKQFQRLNAKKEDRKLNASAIRSSQNVQISLNDIQVGDVLHVGPGDILAADGILIKGTHVVKCDESAATGESDAVRKASLHDCLLNGDAPSSDDGMLDNSSSHPDPFLISGAKVLEGECTYLVTAVGAQSIHGKTLMALRTKDECTPLQEKLDRLAGNIAKLGVSAAGVLFIILLVRCVLSFATTNYPISTSDVISQLMRILITTVTTVVVAVPEGLPLAVTLALAYATQRMLKDNNLVRVLAACETMGNATTICSDKTGTLTQNKMAVVAGTFGSSFRFLKDSPSSRGDLIDLEAVHFRLPLPVRNFLNQAMIINSSVMTTTDEYGKTTLVGNKTETAMLNFTQDNMACEPIEQLRSWWPVEYVYPFNSTRKCMATVIRITTLDENTKKEKTIYRLHVKGASEMLLNSATHIISMHAASYDRFQGVQHSNSYDIETRIMTDANRTRMAKIIQSYATRCLRTLALCYRDFDTWSPEQNIEDVLAEGGLTLLGIVGIEDPLRSGVRSAVAACQQAGVCVRMVTGDNMLTAKSIARQCGIYTPGGKALDGPTFRQLSPIERLRVLPGLQVLARSSPEDKRLLVQGLRELGDTVAVTGDGTNDAPALKAADVGFSMGLSGTEVAKEASSIILMDDNFSSIVRAISWGRCVNDAVKKFLQFQLTVNVTAVVLTLVSAVTSDDQQSVLTAVQLLWVNLIMDTLAALALATDPPTPSLLKRRPEPRTAPLITRSMWKMIVGQAIYQIVVILTLMYTNILNLSDDKDTLATMVFTAFVFCQFFNEINCRRIDNQFNIFKGITKNRFFVAIFLITIIGQILIVQFGGSAFQTVPLDTMHWVLCILVGFMSLPVGALIRLIPDEILESAHPSSSHNINSSTASVINHSYIVPIPEDEFNSTQSKKKSLR
ncbi:PMCA-type calcium-translocating P-type ATPase, partial [Lichtheimia hyalospora FSU 10163]